MLKKERTMHRISTDINLDKAFNAFNAISPKIEKNIQDAKQAQPQSQQHLNTLQVTSEYQNSTEKSNPYRFSSDNTARNQLKITDETQPKISETFQAYFGKSKVRPKTILKSQTIDIVENTQNAYRIKSVEVGKELADEVKYTTEEQL